MALKKYLVDYVTVHTTTSSDTPRRDINHYEISGIVRIQ